MRRHLQPAVRPPGGETESRETAALGVVPPVEAEDYAMPDDFHPETGNTQCPDAGCGRADGTDVRTGGDPEAFPEIKFSFSLSGLLLLLIWCYKKAISPMLPRCCRFTPTCSAYAAEAIMTHGVLKGLCLAAWRLLRCQPFCRGGYDPVPPRGSWRVKS